VRSDVLCLNDLCHGVRSGREYALPWSEQLLNLSTFATRASCFIGSMLDERG
jgi:hypothetical protein